MKLVSIVHCPLSIVNCPFSSVQYSLSIVHCPLSIVQCRVSSVQYPVSSVECRVSSVQCPVSSVQWDKKVLKTKSENTRDYPEQAPHIVYPQFLVSTMRNYLGSILKVPNIRYLLTIPFLGKRFRFSKFYHKLILSLWNK